MTLCIFDTESLQRCGVVTVGVLDSILKTFKGLHKFVYKEIIRGKIATPCIVKIFGALPGTLFIYLSNFSVYSIDTIFILGDGLIRLLLRWEKSAPILFCSWIFLG